MARRCIAKKVVTRKDGGQQTVCARYENTEDPTVMARSHEDDGQIGALDLEIIRGLDFSPEALIPPVVGVGVAAATSLLIRKYATNVTLVKYSHVLGGVASVIAAVPMKMWKGDQAMQSAAMAGLLYGVVNQVVDFVKTTTWGAGIGILVPQREAVGMLPSYIPDNGANMPRQLRSAIDPGAYGTASV